MTAGIRSHRSRPLKRLAGCLVIILLEGVAARAQQADQLQEQLQQLKQQYDATTRDLERRIAALEAQAKRQVVGTVVTKTFDARLDGSEAKGVMRMRLEGMTNDAGTIEFDAWTKPRATELGRFLRVLEGCRKEKILLRVPRAVDFSHALAQRREESESYLTPCVEAPVSFRVPTTGCRALPGWRAAAGGPLPRGSGRRPGSRRCPRRAW